MDNQQSILIKAFAMVWVYIIIITAAAYVVFDWVLAFDNQIALSLFLGGVVSVMLWSMTYKSAFKTSQTNPQAFQSVSVRNYIIRFAFYALILVIAHYSPNLEPIATFVGFTSFKIAVLIAAFMNRKDDAHD